MGKGEQTRTEIVRQAATLFNRKGYAGAAISDVMAATGLEKGGIYRHFESKDELALAAFDHALERVNQRYLQAIRQSTDAVTRLRAIVHAFAELQQDVPLAGGCPIMNTAIDSDDTHPRLRQRAAEALDNWHDMLADIIRRGQERGQLITTAEPAAVATRLIALMEGGLMMARLTQEPAHLAHTLAGLESWIDGLRLAA